MATRKTRKTRATWRNRKTSMAHPVATLECGCRYYVRDSKPIVANCNAHRWTFYAGKTLADLRREIDAAAKGNGT